MLSLIFLILAAPSYYGAKSMYDELIKPKFAFRQNGIIFSFKAVGHMFKGYVWLIVNIPRLALKLVAYICYYTILQVLRWGKNRVDKKA
jgi:hypothetical protein